MRSHHTAELGFVMVFVVFCILRTGKTINAMVDATVVASDFGWGTLW